jgi:hypothetical protein
MSDDEKGAKFTGNSSHLLAANKPEGKVVSWTSDIAIETRHNESFVIHLKTHRSDPSGSQSLWDEYYKNWCVVYEQVAHEATVKVTDSHYMCKEVLEKAVEKGIKFISGFDSNKFKTLTTVLDGRATKAGEWSALYNEEENLLVMKRIDHEGKTKYSISNYMDHSRGRRKNSDLHQWDAYDDASSLCDRCHQQIMTKQHRRFPFRHGSQGHPGIESHIFDILWCFIIEDVRVAYRALRTPDIERPKYGPFVASLAIHLIERGLKRLNDEEEQV